MLFHIVTVLLLRPSCVIFVHNAFQTPAGKAEEQVPRRSLSTQRLRVHRRPRAHNPPRCGAREAQDRNGGSPATAFGLALIRTCLSAFLPLLSCLNFSENPFCLFLALRILSARRVCLPLCLRLLLPLCLPVCRRRRRVLLYRPDTRPSRSAAASTVWASEPL